METEGYIVDAIDEVTDPGNEMGNKGIVKKWKIGKDMIQPI